MLQSTLLMGLAAIQLTTAISLGDNRRLLQTSTTTVTFTTYMDADCTITPAIPSVVTMDLNTPCNLAPKASMSNLQCFSDKISYTNHPNDFECGSSFGSFSNELRVGVCTEFPGPVPTWKLIEADTYTCVGSTESTFEANGNTETMFEEDGDGSAVKFSGNVKFTGEDSSSKFNGSDSTKFNGASSKFGDTASTKFGTTTSSKFNDNGPTSTKFGAVSTSKFGPNSGRRGRASFSVGRRG